MARLFAPTLALAAVAAFAFVAACSAFDAGSDAAPPSEDAGTDAFAACSMNLGSDSRNCGRCGHVCAATESCEKSTCRPGCSDKLIRVSTTGDDMNDGCSIARPMKTIGAAIARAKTIQAKDHSVVVCRGVYAEHSLVLDFPLSLRGGFECSTFARTKDFGYPLFDATTDTTIDDANEGLDRSTLTISSAAVTRSVMIEGFTIAGARSGDARSSAVSITAGASPTLRDLKIVGGATKAPVGNGSKGLFSSGGSPDIGKVQVTGGGGLATDGTSYEVIGIHVSGGSPYLHDLTVSANAGTLRAQAYAVVAQSIDARGANAWHDVLFAGGALSTSGGGLALTNSRIEITTGRIAGPSIACSALACNAFGVVMLGGELIMQSSRIYGGETTGANAAVYGIAASGGARLVLTNNTIVAGNTARRVGPYAIGVGLTSVAASRLVHNDIVVPETNGSPAYETVGIWLQGSIPPDTVDFENNLVSGTNGGSLHAIRVERCAGATAFGKVRGNAFVNAFQVLTVFATSACAPSSFASVTDGELALASLATAVVGNVRLGTNCGNDAPSKCKVCSAAGACPGLVVTPWTATGPSPSPTAAELFGSAGYDIPVGAPCIVTMGGVTLSPAVDVDAKGKPRAAAMRSIGAFELAIGCTN